MEFDGTELKEVKPKEKAKPKGQTAEQLMVSALYKAGRSTKTWKQCCGIFRRMNNEQGTTFYVPKYVTVAGRRYEMLPFGSDKSGDWVKDIYEFTNGGPHGGDHLIPAVETAGSPY